MDKLDHLSQLIRLKTGGWEATAYTIPFTEWIKDPKIEQILTGQGETMEEAVNKLDEKLQK